MATVDINVYGRDYAIACDDGEEAHLGKLTHMVNHRVQELLKQMGRAPEHTMLIYTSLMLADELLDVTRAYKKLEASTKKQLEEAQAQPKSDSVELLAFENKMAGNLTDLAGQIEQLAEQLEQQQQAA